jgi:hypothetical protein
MVMAIAEARVVASSDNQFANIVEGKGQGVITVLQYMMTLFLCQHLILDTAVPRALARL